MSKVGVGGLTQKRSATRHNPPPSMAQVGLQDGRGGRPICQRPPSTHGQSSTAPHHASPRGSVLAGLALPPSAFHSCVSVHVCARVINTHIIYYFNHLCCGKAIQVFPLGLFLIKAKECNIKFVILISSFKSSLLK